MDLRDSSATPQAEANSLTDKEVATFSALARDALFLFQSRKYSECLELLQQLAQKKNDPKVLHNIAITEFFRDGSSNPKRLIEVLYDVKRKSEDITHTSLQEVEAGSNAGNRASTVAKGNASTLENQSIVGNNTSNFYADEFDQSVTILNIAVIWFHLCEYSKALSILEPLYNKIQAIDETIALHICLLLLDVALACHDVKKTADVLVYLEKPPVSSQVDNGSVTQQQSSNLASRSSSFPSNSVADGSDLGSSATGNSSEKSLSRTFSEETLDYETMMSTLDIGGENLNTSSQILPSSNNFSRTTFDKCVPSVDLKFKLQLYKVRFLLLAGNLKAAKREVKGAMDVRGDSSIACLLKSQLEYARGNYRKAIKLLMSLENRTEGATASIFFNNLGCIYHQLMKSHSASLLFTKALTFSSSLRKEKPLKLSTISQDKSLYISYNSGLQYLVCGKPVLAARCLQRAVSAFYNQPLFWFRLAECCIMFVNGGSALLDGGSEVNVSVIGKGKWRRLAVGKTAISHSGEKVDGSHTKLSLPLARFYLLNALHILEGTKSTENLKPLPTTTLPNGDLTEPNKGELISSSLSIHEDVSRRKTEVILQAVLANRAYVELELENPVVALSSALSLLQLPNCSKVYAFLGHIYAAEALCLMNRPTKAAEHLSSYISEGSNVKLPFSEPDLQQWRVENNSESEESTGLVVSDDDSSSLKFLKPEEARAALYVNLAAGRSFQGDFQSALDLVNRALAVVPNCREAVLTAVYVHLSMGNSQEAIEKLKHLSRVRFLPFAFNSNKQQQQQPSSL